MSGYVFRPDVLAATMRQRQQAGHSHAIGEQDGAIWVGSADRPLFRLNGNLLESPYGQVEMPPEAASSLADPLWEAQDGICSHMEQDHGDTFATFLEWLGEEGPALGMPWVEEQGFFLRRSSGDDVFLPFPTPCPDPNSVRASLIKMLRKARAVHG